MLSAVLNSNRAVQVSVLIVRAFVRLRQLLASNSDLTRRLADLEQKYDRQFTVVFDAIRALMTAPDEKPGKQRIGYKTGRKTKDR
jgi:hypothetical protein